MSTNVNTHLAEVHTMALRIFKSEVIANQWLNKPNFALGCTPLEAAQTESGALKVQKILAAMV